MTTLHDQLNELAGPLTQPSPEQVDADVARGRRALRRRRALQATGGSAVAAAVLAAALTYGAVGSNPSVPSTAAGSSAPAATTPLRLVAFQGEQPEGYTLDTIPDGWEIQGVNAYRLTLAPIGASDQEPDSFAGKIVVMLQADEGFVPEGTTVRVGDRSGVLVDSPDGLARTLWIKHSADAWVLVQVWRGLGMSVDDIADLAAGIHVHADAQPGHG